MPPCFRRKVFGGAHGSRIRRRILLPLSAGEHLQDDFLNVLRRQGLVWTKSSVIKEEFYVLATSVLADSRPRVLKYGDTCGVFDSHGDILSAAHLAHGLYHRRPDIFPNWSCDLRISLSNCSAPRSKTRTLFSP